MLNKNINNGVKVPKNWNKYSFDRKMKFLDKVISIQNKESRSVVNV
jgi:hypothetical protein